MMTQPVKWHGGKFYLAERILDRMPRHLNYVEPYAGGLAVLFRRDPVDVRFFLSPHKGVAEVVNDLNGDLVNFYRVLADSTWFAEFARIVEATPFSEYAYQSAARHDAASCTSAVTNAYAFFVRCRMSLAGRMKSFTGVTKTRLRRGMNNEVSAWLSAVEGLPAVHERLRRVLILNRDACDVIRDYDRDDTVIYCDPPYLKATRAAPDVYAHEMSDEQHRTLLETLKASKAKVLLSGYRCPLYDEMLPDWRREDFDLANNSAGGETKRRMTECLWLNFD